MGKTKKDPSRAGLGSPNVQGQGTTTSETGTHMSSTRKKQKRD
ncbi:YuzL family protein [Bacillus sp. AFS041924]|nr:YuzL family protein [Bacillus sp. AFS041924]PGS47320.1 YuzL family protein [Bacillus sp. AFS041924]